MDDIAAMVAEAIARRVKAAQAQSASDPRAQQLLARVNALTQAAAPKPAAPAAKPPVPMGRTTAPPPVLAPDPPPVDTLAIDTLPGLPLSILDTHDAVRPDLLDSFSGPRLLSAIVLSEAFARPVALREDGLGTSR